MPIGREGFSRGEIRGKAREFPVTLLSTQGYWFQRVAGQTIFLVDNGLTRGVESHVSIEVKRLIATEGTPIGSSW